MSINILDELHNDFLVYASEVNNNRAFADVRDGLKPSQRAVLYTMFSHGFSSNKPHVKSAKVDGAVIGELWPHGSEYTTIVRMSQPWVNNICEIDFHGGNGSIQGGPDAASSRYTECKLSKAAEEGLFEGIKKDTVDMIWNFSEDIQWPSVLPAIFPRLFVNGTSGIGYTIANDWQPGNLNEFASKVKTYIKTKKVDCSDIYPDYPTGGTIINKSNIHTIYETGKGTILVRAKTNIIDNIIQITELPYQVYAEPLIAKIKDLVNNEQIAGIEDICNKSDEIGLCIEIECSEDPIIVLNNLFKLTDLQCSFSANQMALVDKVPTLLNLEQYIDIYIKHNIECIKREYKYDLNKAQQRLEVVDGLVKALGVIDQVIDTIKQSKSTEIARENLIKAYAFTENQAKAIIEMRLGKLANLEIKALHDEQSDLNKIVDDCNKILGSSKSQEKEFIKRLDNFVNRYGWERRTEVIDIDIAKEKAITKKVQPKSEDCFIVLTAGNYIKRISLTAYKPQTKYKSETDKVVNAIKVGTKDKVILVSESGKMYKLQANKIANCSMNSTGMYLGDLFTDKIINIYSGTEAEQYLFFITNTGSVKKIVATDVFNIGKNTGTTVMKLDNNYIIDCRLTNDEIIKYEINGKEKLLDTAKFKPHGRNAGGVAGIKIKPNQTFTLI